MNNAPSSQSDRVYQVPPGKMTLTLLAICLVIYALFHIGLTQIYPWLMMSETAIGIDEIKQGQIWRLLTPIFLHSPVYYGGVLQPVHILHIVFNLLWLLDLGGAIEANESSRRLLLLVLLVGVVSNFIQYLSSNTQFFGMSGVVYGLLGYIWYLSHFAGKKTGYHVNRAIMLLMVGWLVFCYTGLAGSIANAAHLSGLLFGILLGFFAEKIWSRNPPKIHG